MRRLPGKRLSCIVILLVTCIGIVTVLTQGGCTQKPSGKASIAARLSANDYTTRAHAVYDLMREDVHSGQKYSDSTIREIIRVVDEFPAERSRRSYRHFLMWSNINNKRPEEMSSFSVSFFDADCNVLERALREEGIL
jgi:hypothetical protein